MQEHFDILAKENPWSEFEERVVKFLTTATRTQANPTLSQLENGRLEGFDTRDVQAVLANAGANLQA